MWSNFQKEIATFSKSQKIFILFAMLCGFCISAEYAVIRPVSNALFITAYSANAFPWVWLAMVPINFLVVALYNKFLPILGCLKLFLISCALIIGLNIFFAYTIQYYYIYPFLFYLWKEIYVLLMFQQLWSVIHANVKFSQAKYLYGLIFAIGGAGGVFGSTFSGFFAVNLGSENLLFATLPLYLTLIGTYLGMLTYSLGLNEKDWITKNRSSWKQGLEQIKSSKTLVFIMMLVLFMQISSTLIYYEFNTILENTISNKDLRTEYCGRVFGIVNSLTILLQLLGSFLLVHFAGMRIGLFTVPSVLAITIFGVLLFPSFPMISLAYIGIKSLDFSVFGILKEMLYTPLKQAEKFQAKAVIDIFVYRSAKAFASFLILYFQWIGASLTFLSCANLGIFFVWGWIIWRYCPESEITGS
jgi:AAA family ATP:ADP antiporter